MNDIVERFQKVSACDVSDALSRVGLSPIGLVGIRALEPAKKFVGRAFTVLFEPIGAANHKGTEYMEYVKPGDAIMISNTGLLEASSWGGQRSIAAMQKGAVGTVAYGAYRDVEEHQKLGYPVYGLGPTVAASKNGAIPVEFNQEIFIAGCKIVPGDFVVADASGVVVVPQSAAEDVAREAEILAEEARAIMDAVSNGKDWMSLRGATGKAKLSSTRTFDT